MFACVCLCVCVTYVWILEDVGCFGTGHISIYDPHVMAARIPPSIFLRNNTLSLQTVFLVPEVNRFYEKGLGLPSIKLTHFQIQIKFQQKQCRIFNVQQPWKHLSVGLLISYWSKRIILTFREQRQKLQIGSSVPLKYKTRGISGPSL